MREVINARERSFSDFLSLLANARKFKKWLEKQNPDQKLLDAYYAEVTKKGWIGKLPSKTTRWTIATGLGVAAETLYPSGIGTALGMGVTALDAFMLDRLLRGWRPNQFIQLSLSKFTGLP